MAMVNRSCKVKGGREGRVKEGVEKDGQRAYGPRRSIHPCDSPMMISNMDQLSPVPLSSMISFNLSGKHLKRRKGLVASCESIPDSYTRCTISAPLIVISGSILSLHTPSFVDNG